MTRRNSDRFAMSACGSSARRKPLSLGETSLALRQVGVTMVNGGTSGTGPIQIHGQRPSAVREGLGGDKFRPVRSLAPLGPIWCAAHASACLQTWYPTSHCSTDD